ncbi:hypothetical protein AABB24_017568 [Solanum stoloniferum]|uniref:Uncharacterized protein n=1 Tax=Solanum stoloniferum TaxID=62892 RepID=A0ABD2TN60_9SOLN
MSMKGNITWCGIHKAPHHYNVMNIYKRENSLHSTPLYTLRSLVPSSLACFFLRRNHILFFSIFFHDESSSTFVGCFVFTLLCFSLSSKTLFVSLIGLSFLRILADVGCSRSSNTNFAGDTSFFDANL